MIYDTLKEMILNGLNDNPYGIIFDLDVFNSPEYNYEKKYDDEIGLGVTTKRVVPTMITAPFGDRLLVQDTDAIQGSMNMVFDMFIEDETKFNSLDEENKFKSVNFDKTLQAINDFIGRSLLKTNVLGEPSLFFGGEDSSATSSGASFGFNTIYLKIDIQDFYSENVLTFKFENDEVLKLARTKNGNIQLTIVGDATVLTIPYTLGEQEILVWRNTDGFHLNDASGFIPLLGRTSDEFIIGETTGLNAKLYDLRIGDTTLTYDTISNVDNNSFILMYNDFLDDVLVPNGGVLPNYDLSVSNAILWGKDGNLLLGFTTLVPDDGIDTSTGHKYQLFSLSMPFLLSKDVVFGNSFRYFLNVNANADGTYNEDEFFEVFAIDRQHTNSGEDTSYQPINANVAKGINSETMKGLTKTFVYKPSRQMTKLLKRIMTSDIEQNERFAIKVKAPFFTTTYSCYVVNGGNGTEPYSYSTFTIEFKEVVDYIATN